MDYSKPAEQPPAPPEQPPQPPQPLTQEQLALRFAQAFPELNGPGTDTVSGEVRYRVPPSSRVGPVPAPIDPGMRDRENAKREAEAAVWSGIERKIEVAASRIIQTAIAAERRTS
jgi:hypothetical protein